MGRSEDPQRTEPESRGPLKSPEAQVEEIHKLVSDAQEKLDQVSRALRSLGERLGPEDQAPRR